MQLLCGMALRLYCLKPWPFLFYILRLYRWVNARYVTPLLMHWSYVFLALTHRYDLTTDLKLTLTISNDDTYHINDQWLGARRWYRQPSNIRHTKSQNFNASHIVLQLSLPNPLKPGVREWRCSWSSASLEQRQLILEVWRYFHHCLAQSHWYATDWSCSSLLSANEKPMNTNIIC